MDHFRDGQHVRLRSRVHDTYYLHADDDGESVSISRRRYSLNAAWTVHIYHGDGSHLLLHSAAYGRYLAAASKPASFGHRGFRAEQRDYDQPVLAAIMWQAVEVGSGSGGGVLLRNIGGRYLRAGGRLRRYLRWNTRVSVEYTDNVSATMHWIVEPIRPRARPPLIPGPIRTRVPGDLSVIMLGRKAGAWWRIRFVRASDEGLYNEDGWSALRIRGRSVYHLRNALASRVGDIDIHGQRRDMVMCVRAGLYGRLTPLVVNLPHGRHSETLDIVVMLSGTPAYDALRYPDVVAK
ncbi:uncharacterized protein LOC123408238 [Hordeum vulgare subsp. vulgare]|uniref:uncharacterized protein LOC123408238 n=1 Tax=Hordeum vulgare subsp. vulgare TaxID=112509 RepID=UPI00162CDA68|nr:uncharacterized protein LOC123408238 [Hordeum vulgare subsp. vulgare]